MSRRADGASRHYQQHHDGLGQTLGAVDFFGGASGQRPDGAAQTLKSATANLAKNRRTP
jgi:hypothetical protein